MAATVLSVTDIARTGPALSPAAANADGHLLPNSGREFVAVTNGGASPITVSATIVQTVDGVTPAAKSITIAAGVTKFFGPFPRTEYNNASQQVALAFSDVSSVTIQALRLAAAL